VNKSYVKIVQEKIIDNEQVSLADRFKRLSRFWQIVILLVLAFIIWVVISIPGDRSELLDRQDTTETTRLAFNGTLPDVGTALEAVSVHLENADIDLSGNQLYTRLGTALTSFNRTNTAISRRVSGAVTFSENVHSLLDGNNAVEELDTEEFRELVAEMDVVLNTMWLALQDYNTAVDQYSDYSGNFSAAWTIRIIFGFPSYDDPIPDGDRLNGNTSLLLDD